MSSQLKSTLYFDGYNDLLRVYDNTKVKCGQFLCTSILTCIHYYEIQRKSKSISAEYVQERSVPSRRCEEGRGNIRYVGGYCVAKLKIRYQNQAKMSLFDPSKKLENCRQKKCYLNHLTESYSDLSLSAKYPESLITTFSKQNIRQSIRNINDSVFLFFELLNSKIHVNETFKNLNTFGKDTVNFIKSNVIENVELLSTYHLTLFGHIHSGNNNDDDDENFVSNITILEDLFREICSKFIMVSASQFRKDYLTLVKREKGKSALKNYGQKSPCPLCK